MNIQELQDVVVRNTAELSEIRQQLNELVSKEKRVETALGLLRRRVLACLEAFHRDKYKSTDQRLLIRSLAEEILIFDKLGYDIGVTGSRFLLGVSALLDGRNQAAQDHFCQFIDNADTGDKNLRDCHYLSAMISYNRRDYNRAIDHFESAFRYSPDKSRDWQCKIYVGELMYFLRTPRELIEKAFQDVDDELRAEEGTPQYGFLRATLYLKWGNCYLGTLDLEPKERNLLVNNQVAISRFKQAKKLLPKLADPNSLLPVVLDYSLAQALLLARSMDMELALTPSQLFETVFDRLRKIVLTKREEIILAQSYLMLGTCAYYSAHVSKDLGGIYLEYARNQTLSVPSDVCFFSCITKELLSRDEFVSQIDHYAKQLEQSTSKR